METDQGGLDVVMFEQPARVAGVFSSDPRYLAQDV
jgi:hypothetical protein